METSSNIDLLKVKAREFNVDEDYETISDWWTYHDSFVPFKFHLPKTGIMIEYFELPVCVGFLYKTDSKICVFEFVVSDPSAHKDVRNLCIDVLISEAVKWTEKNGFNLIYTSTSITKYINRLKEQGFIEADKNQTHMFKVIENV